MTNLTIGAVVRKAGISPCTLRAWERDGVIPRPHRSSDGRRQFDEAAAAVIVAIAERRREERYRPRKTPTAVEAAVT